MKYLNNFMFYAGMPFWLLLTTLSWAIYRSVHGPCEWIEAYQAVRSFALGGYPE